MAAIELSDRSSVLSVDEVDGEQLIIRSALRKSYRFVVLIILATCFQCGFGLMSVFLLALWLGQIPPLNQMGGWVFLPLGMICGGLALAVTSAIAFAQTMYDRCFTFDLRSKVCHFENVPRFGCVLPFADIESILMCSTYGKGGSGAHLCLAVRGWKRYLRIHSIGRSVFHRDGRDALLAELQPFAEALSRLLDVPIERIGNVSPFRLSWP